MLLMESFCGPVSPDPRSFNSAAKAAVERSIGTAPWEPAVGDAMEVCPR